MHDSFGPAGLPDKLQVEVAAPKSSKLRPACEQNITPNCLQSLYNIPTKPATQPNNKLFVSEFIGQFAPPSDLSAFLQQYRPEMPSNTSLGFLSIAGGQNDNNATDAGDEADLDIQYTVGLATGVPTTFVATGPSNYTTLDIWFQSLLDEANYLVEMDDPPTVLSTSYGEDEDFYTSALAT